MSRCKVALIAGIGLLAIALLTPFARLGVLQALVVPAGATATVNNIIASEGLFRSGIAAFLIVIVMDVVVARAGALCPAETGRPYPRPPDGMVAIGLRYGFRIRAGESPRRRAARWRRRTVSAARGATPGADNLIHRFVRRRLGRRCLTTSGSALPWRSSASISWEMDTFCSARHTLPGSSVFSWSSPVVDTWPICLHEASSLTSRSPSACPRSSAKHCSSSGCSEEPSRGVGRIRKALALR